jgi:hypothetical protein
VGKEEERNQKDLARCSQISAQSGTPDSVWCASLISGEKAALGKRSAAYDYNSPDCPVSQRSPAQRSVVQSTSDACPAPTVGRGHQTVFGAPSCPKLQRSIAPYLEGNHTPDSYSDCPVVHRTEGKISLPRLSSTAPSCLGTIKETPRRMEVSSKHSLSILRHPDSVPAHSFRCVRDLSSIRVKDSLCCHLSSSLLLCAWVCCDLCLVCVAHANLTPCFHCDLCCKGERLQSCGYSSQMGIII